MDRESRIASLGSLVLREQTLPKAGYILKHRLRTAHMPDKSLSVVAAVVADIYQCNPAIPHNDRIHPLQECLSPGLSPKTLGFKVADCQAECNISLKTSLAVLYFRTFLGLSLISSTACCTSSFVTLLKSLPLGEELPQDPVGVLNC
ncbi:MAG: hypothetical protein DUD39_05435 [Coriobacteriaceae bacterium]|nr:MAG: hypothetical protein DUD39_05435 [Coriobacteriaceae bacterium]